MQRTATPRESSASNGGRHPAASVVVRGITRRYYTVWLGYSLAGGFLYGVYPLFLRSRGLTQFEMNSVLACYFVVMFLTDVPTGAFADALGRRRSFMLGCALRVNAFLTYFFAHRFGEFVVAECIDGIGTTFCNGAIDAWGVDALDAAGFVGLKDRLFSRISQFTNLGFMMAALIGASVADINIAWPWLLGAAGYCLSAIVGAALMREGRRGAYVAFRAIPLQVGRRVADGLRQGFRSRAVVLLSLANGVFFAAWAPYWMQWPQFFNDAYGVGIWVVGLVFCLFTVARMSGAEVVARLRADVVARTWRLCLLVLAMSGLLFTAGTAGHRPNFVLATLFAMNLCIGGMQPLMTSWFNEQIGANERATLLSFNNTFATLGGSMGLLLGGAVADRFGISSAWQLSGMISLAALPCYWLLRPRPAAVPVVPQVAK
ncbi:MAG: MFS transporter [Candidatus Binataceae bacterium]